MLNLPCLRKEVFLSLLEFIELEELNSLSPGKVASFSSLAVLRQWQASVAQLIPIAQSIHLYL